MSGHVSWHTYISTSAIMILLSFSPGELKLANTNAHVDQTVIRAIVCESI